MNKFKIGDRVKLVKMEGESPWYKDYLGKVYTIASFDKDQIGAYTRFKETYELVPYLKNLKLVKDEYTHEDLKKVPIGTKITFQNGYLIKFDKERVYGVINGIYYNGKIDYIILFLKGKVTDGRFGEIIKIEEPIYQTVYEHKEEILDEAEKRYLKAVIRPFRARMKYIMKEDINYATKEYIRIDLGREMINLPKFDSGSMYKGMKLNKGYTLEELGL